MERYRDLDGDSNVLEYELGNDYIKVRFADGSVYLYTYLSTGSQNVEEMKRLAVVGEGLNKFISKFVRKNYASKLV
jgi:hypothetical protein